MISIEHLICYGDRRNGIGNVFDCTLAKRSRTYGFEVVNHWSRDLDRFGN